MTACPDKLLLLHGLVDDELDAANSLAIEAHLKSCPGCSEELARIEAVRRTLAGASLGHRAPDALRNRIDQQLAEAAPRARPLASQRPPEVAPSRWQPAGRGRPGGEPDRQGRYSSTRGGDRSPAAAVSRDAGAARARGAQLQGDRAAEQCANRNGDVAHRPRAHHARRAAAVAR